MKKVPVKNLLIGPKEPLTIMCGPCVIESEEHCLLCATTLQEMFAKTNIRLIFKASYDKANRASHRSFRGPGQELGLKILKKVKQSTGLPLVTDIHTPEEAKKASVVVDVLQIPAFLSRQTDLLIAAAQTGSVVEVKKGQFMSPWEMKNVVAKLEETGCQNILLVDRGTTFGYNNLVVDFRSFPIMQQFGYPVGLDASHAVQLPGAQGDSSGGDRQFIPYLAKAAVAAGANFLFIEAHPEPDLAKSDKSTVYPFEKLPKLLSQLEKIYETVTNDEF